MKDIADKSPIEVLGDLIKYEEKNKLQISIIDIYLDLFLEMTTEVKKEVYLKGNVLLNQLLKDKARSTIDLDMSVVSKEIYDTILIPKLKKFGDNAIRSGIANSYEIKEVQPKKSGGIEVKDKNNKIVYSIDVSLSDIHPQGIKEYNFGGRYAYGSSIEKILADKCLSTLSLKRFRRMKDFYDLYILLDSELSYNSDVILSLMVFKVGTEEVKYLLNNQPFSEEIIIQANYAWDKLRLTNETYIRDIIKPEFGEVVEKCYQLYDKLTILS